MVVAPRKDADDPKKTLFDRDILLPPLMERVSLSLPPDRRHLGGIDPFLGSLVYTKEGLCRDYALPSPSHSSGRDNGGNLPAPAQCVDFKRQKHARARKLTASILKTTRQSIFFFKRALEQKRWTGPSVGNVQKSNCSSLFKNEYDGEETEEK